MSVRAVRGATQVGADEREQVLAFTRELVSEVMAANKLELDDVISVVFSATADLASVAPALAARQLGLHEAALLCMQEMRVHGAMPRVIRLIAHVETELPRAELQNVYLHGTEFLRADVPAIPE